MTKNPKLATLTPEEDKAWVEAFTYYVSKGWSDAKADQMAWKDLTEIFPRLKAFDGAKPQGGAR